LETDHEANARGRVLLTVSQIPSGRVSSFGRVAQAAGFPRRARWVGRILSQLPQSTNIPWHRVLSHNGLITCPKKELAQTRLKKEGIDVHEFRVNMRRYTWPD
jgi:methylated-DNA-protein-cysteine methyltransferase-like protein